MNAFKATLPLGDQTVIERVLTSVRCAGIEDIWVVTGFNREQLVPMLGNAKEVYNPDFDRGMFSSIKAGVRAVPPELDGFFLLPVDCPLIPANVIEQLITAFEPGSDHFYVPCYKGKKGHPLLIPRHYRKEIISYDGPGGLKGVTDRDFQKMIRIEVDSEGILMDMDDRTGYEAVKAYLAGGCRSENLVELALGRRLFLIRHGQISQHKEKIFLGQSDSPLSDMGLEQAKAVAAELSCYSPETDVVYTSDLKRAVQTAQYAASPDKKAVQADGKRLILEPGLREVNLGPWDGKLISEIREQYPDEYETRGKNLMTYKFGHGSENFYDLQYRVEKTLIRLLKNDQRKDMIIVSHSGVLRCISNNLQGKSVDETWDKMEVGELRVVSITFENVTLKVS
jgi:broad specificity phosphatase PhoE/CTP:molybdopterin cytidylyltransferase MocA